MAKASQIKNYIPYKRVMILLKKETNPKIRQKLQALAWIAEGVKTEDIAERLGRNVQTIYNYVHLFDNFGIEAFLKTMIESNSKPSQVTHEHWVEVMNWLRQPPEKMGLPFTYWTYKNLIRCIKWKWGFLLSKETIQFSLNQLGCNWDPEKTTAIGLNLVRSNIPENDIDSFKISVG